MEPRMWGCPHAGHRRPGPAYVWGCLGPRAEWVKIMIDSGNTVGDLVSEEFAERWDWKAMTSRTLSQ